MKEIQKLSEDVCVLTQISDLTLTLQCPRASLEEIVKDMLSNVNKQLAERQTSDSQLSYLELMLNTQFVYRISFFFFFFFLSLKILYRKNLFPFLSGTVWKTFPLFLQNLKKDRVGKNHSTIVNKNWVKFSFFLSLHVYLDEASFV